MPLRAIEAANPWSSARRVKAVVILQSPLYDSSRSRLVSRSAPMNRIVLSTSFVLAAVVSAQEARLSGTVSDSSGAAVPTVNISAVQVERQVSFQTQTDAEGRY